MHANVSTRDVIFKYSCNILNMMMKISCELDSHNCMNDISYYKNIAENVLVKLML